MSEKSSIGGGNSRTTSTNSDFASHGGTKDKDYNSHGEQIAEVHHTSDGKSHEHEVSHGLFGNYAGKKK
jgi:hypothetical protein